MFLKKTPLAWARSLAVCACVGLTLLSACSDDDSKDSVDTDLPTVTITGLQDNATIWNSVSLTIAADDNKAIKEVELLIDNKSILTKTETSFDYVLNTAALNLADGQHMLTIIVTDDSGNEKKLEYTFTVRNTLITINVPANQLRAQERGFIFLSDATGKVIVSQEYTNNQEIRLTAPTYEGADFYLTEVIVDNGDNRQELATFQKVTRGTWSLEPYYVEETSPVYVGQADLSFTLGLPDTYYIISAGYDYTYYSSDDSQQTRSLELHKNPSRLYITRNEDDDKPTHYLLTPVSVGPNAPIDLSQVNTELTEVSVDLSAYNVHSSWVHIYGLQTPGDFATSYTVFSKPYETDVIKYRYPGNAFANYMSSVELYGNQFIASHQTEGLPDFAPLAVDADVEFKDAKLTGTVTGADVDFIIFVIETDANTTWAAVTEKGAVNIVLPELPNELKTIITTDGQEPTIDLLAFQKFDFDGYDGFLNYTRNSPTGALDLTSNNATYKQLEISLTPDPAGRKYARKQTTRTGLWRGR